MSTAESLERGKGMLHQLSGHEDRGEDIAKIFPDYWKMMQGHLFGEVWSRPGLALRDRIMVNLTCLMIHRFDFGLENTMRWALNNGISREEIMEIIMHIAHYVGVPFGVNAVHVARNVFPPLNQSEEADTSAPEEPDTSAADRLQKGQRLLQQLSGEHNTVVRSEDDMEQVFPEFWRMSQEYIFGEIWSRPGLALRERSIITVAALILLRYNDGLRRNMSWALNNGVSREEIQEIIIHVAHYGGWPCGVNAIQVAKKVFSPPK